MVILVFKAISILDHKHNKPLVMGIHKPKTLLGYLTKDIRQQGIELVMSDLETLQKSSVNELFILTELTYYKLVSWSV